MIFGRWMLSNQWNHNPSVLLIYARHTLCHKIEAITIHEYVEKKVERSMEQKDLLTVKEVSNILRVNDSTLRRWIKNGAMYAVILPHLSGRRGYRIKRETLDALLGQPQPAQ